MSLYFHFTLGPVQSFVAQARRTRDFWAGSFILSWLAAVAMRAVQAQGQKIKFPLPDEAFMRALEGKLEGKNEQGPRQGNIPNRFMAEIFSDAFDVYRVENAVCHAWYELAETVWQADLSHLNGKQRERTREIWERQVSRFWEINWAFAEKPEISDTIDRRKNWRSHFPPPEPSVKCMMMDGWQEISGTPTPHATALSAFWDELRSKGGSTMQRDLRKGEHLCAIAFIKRRFPRHFDKVKIPMSGWTLYGWRVPPQVPSVVYMASAHWLANVITDTQDVDKLITFHDEAAKLSRVEEEFGPHDEWYSKIECILRAEKARKDRRLRYFRALDGNVFFDTALDNENVFDDRVQAQKVKQALRSIIKDSKLQPVSNDFALTTEEPRGPLELHNPQHG